MEEDDDDNGAKNPTLAGRVSKLETTMAEVTTDIKWIKMLVAPTFIVSIISLLLLIASSLRS
jgi:hypothetical protein